MSDVKNSNFPTIDGELNKVLEELVKSVQETLGANFVSAILQGSFAIGGWDNDSDVDFDIVIENDLSENELQALQKMHKRIYNRDSIWAKHLEGSYFPKSLLKQCDPENIEIWYLDNGADTLIRSNHDNTNVVRWVLHEYGIRLAGIPARDLVDPVSADVLRTEIIATMREWAAEIFSNQYRIDNLWAQPFVVLSYSRMLHSLFTGRVASKLDGADWAKANLDERWVDLIQRAWDERPDPSFKVQQKAKPSEIKDTLEFIHYALDYADQIYNS